MVSAEGCFPLCMLGRRGKAAEESPPLQPSVIKGCAETASFPYISSFHKVKDRGWDLEQ